MIIQHMIRLSFISKTEKGAKGKVGERQRESEGERAREREQALGGGRCSVGCKTDC